MGKKQQEDLLNKISENIISGAVTFSASPAKESSNSSTAVSSSSKSNSKSKTSAVDSMWERNSKTSSSKKTSQQLKNDAENYENKAKEAEKKKFSEVKESGKPSNIFDIFNNAYKAVSGISDDSTALKAAQKDEEAQKWRGKSAEASYLAEQTRQEEDAQKQSTAAKSIDSLSQDERSAIEKYLAEDNLQFYTNIFSGDGSWTANLDASKNLAPLIEKYGKDSVDSMVQAMRRETNAQKSAEAQEAGEKFGEEHPILGSLGAIAAAPVNAISSGVGALQSLTQGQGDYSSLDANNSGYLASDFFGGVKSAVNDKVQNIDNADKVLAGLTSGMENAYYGTTDFGQGLEKQQKIYDQIAAEGGDPAEYAGKTLSLLYNVGMSTGENLARSLSLGPASLAVMGTGAFGDSLREASQKGATAQEAVLLASANALIEVASEKIPLDDLLETASSGKQAASEVVKTALKQAGIEASTEELSLLGETIAEMAILKGKSEYTQTIGQLVNQGMSYEEAKAQADKNILDESVETIVQSGLSGALSSAGGSIFANLTDRSSAQLTDSNKRDIADAIAQGESAEEAKAQIEQRKQGEAAEVANATPAVSQEQAKPDLTDQLLEGIAPRKGFATPQPVQNAFDKIQRGEQLSYSDAKAIARNAAALEYLRENSQTEIPSSSNGAELSQRIIKAVQDLEFSQNPNFQNHDESYEEFTPEQAKYLLRKKDKVSGPPLFDGAPETLSSLASRVDTLTNRDLELVAKDPAAVAYLQQNAGMGEVPSNHARRNETIRAAIETLVQQKRANEQAAEDISYKPRRPKEVYDALADDDLADILLEGIAPKNQQEQTVQRERPVPVAPTQSSEEQALAQSVDKQSPEAQAAQQVVDRAAEAMPTIQQKGQGKDYAGLEQTLKQGKLQPADLENALNTLKQGDSLEGLQNAIVTVRAYSAQNADTIKALMNERSKNLKLKQKFEAEGRGGTWAGDKARAAEAQLRKYGWITQYEASQMDDTTGYLIIGKDSLTTIAKQYEKGNYAITPTTVEATTAEQAPQSQEGNAGVQAYENLLTEDNLQPPRRDDVREVKAPAYDSEGNPVSKFVSNALGSNLTPDSFIPTIEKIVGEGGASHEVLTNEESLKNAAKEISKKGIVQSMNDIRNTALSGKASPNSVAEATLLYRFLVEDKSQNGQELAGDVFSSLTKLATNTGRAMQMFTLFRKMTPEGQLRNIQKDIENYVTSMKSNGRIKQDYEVVIDSDLAEAYTAAAKKAQEAKTPAEIKAAKKEIKAAQDAIYGKAAAEMPATFRQKWDCWRHMCMLGNVKTQVRNIAGNAGFVPYAEAKRIMSAAFEKFIPQEQRTKSITLMDETGQELLKWAKEDRKSDEVSEVLGYSAKLGDAKDIVTGKMQDEMRVFNNETLERLRKFTSWAPTAGDMLFKSRYYERALAGFIKARGYTYEDIQSGKVSAKTLSEARDYAINWAMTNTFNDSNHFSDALSNLRFRDEVDKNGNVNWVKRAANIAGESILPYRRTPANILVRAVEYSPAGLIKGAYDMTTKVQNGKMTAATAIDEMCAGLTGMGAMGLGVMLSNAGLLTGSVDDEDEERQGLQSYSLTIGDTSYPIDWAAPANLPLFIGAEISNILADSGKDSSLKTFDSIMESIGGVVQPMMELSCLSSLSDLAQSLSYTDGFADAAFTLAVKGGLGYFTQGIPTLLRQGINASHENKRETFANSESKYGRSMERTLGNIPIVGDVLGLRQDAVDEWGNTESQGNLATRLFNNLINPGSPTKIDTSAKEQEISRLNDVQDVNVSPSTVDKTVSYKEADGTVHQDERLTKEQYRTMEEVQGQTSDEFITEIIEDPSYQNLPDSLKAEVITTVYEYAKEKAKAAALDGYEIKDKWSGEVTPSSLLSGAIQDSASSQFTKAFSAIRNGETGAVDKLSAAYEVYSGLSDEDKTAFKEAVGGRAVDYLNAKEAGVSDDTFATVYGEYDKIYDSDVKAQQKAQDWSIYLADMADKGKITEEQEHILRENLTYSTGFTAGAGKTNDIVDAGFSAAVAKTVDELTEDVDGTNKVATYSALAQAATKNNLNDADTDKLLKLYMTDYDPEAKTKSYDEVKYTYIRASGYSVQEYIDTLAAFKSESKKAAQISAIEATGVTHKEAVYLYNIYKNKSSVKNDMVDYYMSHKDSDESTAPTSTGSSELTVDQLLAEISRQRTSK